MRLNLCLVLKTTQYQNEFLFLTKAFLETKPSKFSLVDDSPRKNANY
jgi:hypothetical protein